MFNAGSRSGSDCDSGNEPDNNRPARQQYTLKGVEADTISLMRSAADKEGMKIGSWVSIRMKEAAERALFHSASNLETTSTVTTDAEIGKIFNESQDEVVKSMIEILSQYRKSIDEQMGRIESELHEITSGQRTIMASLLNHR
jgi:hypothetical protein